MDIIAALIKQVLKKNRREIEFLGVNQKATITPLWTIRLFDMEYHVGLFVARFK